MDIRRKEKYNISTIKKKICGKITLLIFSVLLTALVPAAMGFFSGLFDGDKEGKNKQNRNTEESDINILFSYSVGDDNFMNFIFMYNISSMKSDKKLLNDYGKQYNILKKYQDDIYTRYSNGKMYKLFNGKFIEQIGKDSLTLTKFTICQSGLLLAGIQGNNNILHPLYSNDLGKSINTWEIDVKNIISNNKLPVTDIEYNPEKCTSLFISDYGIYFTKNLFTKIMKVSSRITGRKIFSLGDSYLIIYNSAHLKDVPAAIYYEKNSSYVEFNKNLYRKMIFFDCLKVHPHDDVLCLMLNTTERSPLKYNLVSVHPKRGPIFWELPMSGRWEKMIQIIHPIYSNTIILCIFSGGENTPILIRKGGSINSEDYVVKPNINNLVSAMGFFYKNV